ncbi:MAG: bifunctional lysine ketoglutarate reductase /saccharopine dehydrogenase family protein [Caldilineales bacterium]|nr:bifunctional lysine ketoglutarate reductase /saccharopine dehydrogenase family protein [Caldilineales bacterium]MDW8316651.1 bifunctional lysine ketoglutarate reductase /saccharopine dehydrogenase family protein [Anaerolineae bacterium]
MLRCIGVRREDKSVWERRTPVTPSVARQLVQEHGIEVVVQPSPTRAFSAAEFQQAGAAVEESLSRCPVVFGIKEIPPAALEPGKAYAFFAHVIKGQPYNMPMLRRLLELGCTLIDYERIVDDQGRRLIFFGWHAGVAGALETLWALGRRLAWQGIPTPFTQLRHAYEYHDIAEAKAAVLAVADQVRQEGLPPAILPLTVGVVGYGNVARGVWEVLNLLPIQRVEPADLLAGLPEAAPGTDPRRTIYAATFREEHTVRPDDPTQPFDLQHYYAHGHLYRGAFESYLPALSVVINAVYWDARYPRLVTKEGLRRLFAAGPVKLQVIGDISCDIEGAMECTVKATEPGEPNYVYNPLTGQVVDGVEGEGVVVMAVDILPSELPRDASEDFSRALAPFIPALVSADYSAPFEALALPPEIKRAVIAHRGELTPAYRYLEQHLSAV